jgi:translation initiation factor 2 beta subunit (eIF-2beta)/eIF-5
MATTNIQDIDDPTNRYKRPIIMVKYEGSGKKLKTRLTNLEEIAKKMHVSLEDILKDFRKRIGCLISKDGIMSGKFSVDDLEGHLRAFTRQVVLCQKCKLPELRNDAGDIVCRACGTEQTVKKSKKIKKEKKKKKDEVKVVGEATREEKENESKSNLLLHQLDAIVVTPDNRKQIEFISDALWGDPTAEELVSLEAKIKSLATG